LCVISIDVVEAIEMDKLTQGKHIKSEDYWLKMDLWRKLWVSKKKNLSDKPSENLSPKCILQSYFIPQVYTVVDHDLPKLPVLDDYFLSCRVLKSVLLNCY